MLQLKFKKYRVFWVTVIFACYVTAAVNCMYKKRDKSAIGVLYNGTQDQNLEYYWVLMPRKYMDGVTVPKRPCMEINLFRKPCGLFSLRV